MTAPIVTSPGSGNRDRTANDFAFRLRRHRGAAATTADRQRQKTSAAGTTILQPEIGTNQDDTTVGSGINLVLPAPPTVATGSITAASAAASAPGAANRQAGADNGSGEAG